MKLLLILILFFVVEIILGQNYIKNEYGVRLNYKLRNTSFPHQERINGHNYKDKFYSYEDHYKDSSVIVFIPKSFDIKDTINFVFYFHGWWNNIEKSLLQFNLEKQFTESSKNAILVLPETAKNAPDSFGGKLEGKNVFQNLTKEIIKKLNVYFKKELQIGNITLAGHSGAYRVIAFILANGGVTNKIRNVILFDALYGQEGKYTNWIDSNNGRFINIYTPGGGTKSNSENLLKFFDQKGILYTILDDDFELTDLRKSKIIFIKSQLGHSEVISTNNQFQKFLMSTN